MSNCHAYLTQVFVTAAFQTDADFNHGSLDLINPTIENHMYATNGWSLPIAFNATNPGIRSCYNWRNVTAAGTEGITTVFGGSWYSYSGLSQGWSYAENPSGSNTQLDFSYSGQRLWSILPWGNGISRGTIQGSPTSPLTLTTTPISNPGGGSHAAYWCKFLLLLYRL